MTGFRIRGWGNAVAEGRLTNQDLESRIDTSDEWIKERTGITTRRVGGTTSALAITAARAAIEMAGPNAPAIDVVILATSTPDRMIPGSASAVVGGLGLACGAVDVNAACTGFVHALAAAMGYLELGCRGVLIIGADVMSTITDPDDRGTAILFGDGAGAMFIEAGGDAQILGWDAATDASTEGILYCDHGGLIQMEGAAVFKLAIRAAVDSTTRALAAAELKPGDVDLFVAHQANQRITDAIARRLGFDDDRVASTIAETGNTSAGTIPFSLATAASDGRLPDGSIALLVGFGAGMTWASAVLRWSTK